MQACPHFGPMRPHRCLAASPFRAVCCPHAVGAARVRVHASSDDESGSDLEERIAAGTFSIRGSSREKFTRPIRKFLAGDNVGPGRRLSKALADLGRRWSKNAASRMPEARGDIREIVNQPVFVPLYTLFTVYGSIFKLSFGPQTFVVISDPDMAKQVLLTNAANYSKGILSEILDFVMGQGLIPADGEVWKRRRRVIVPALHKKYVTSMIGMFGDSALHAINCLEARRTRGPVEMEDTFSRLGLDIIGKAVFNYDFDSLSKDDPVIKAVYTVLREAEHRSITPIPYWNDPLLKRVVPRQVANTAALKVVNDTLSVLIARCKALVDREDVAFTEDFLSSEDPSILHFLVAGGDDITSKQLRDDLMTMLVAGHETTAAVLTWTFYILSAQPQAVAQLHEEVDRVLGDRCPTFDDMKELRFTTRVINEAMRLYPQPPVLIRRALADDVIGGYEVKEGSDIFISTWNLHRSPAIWDQPDRFMPERFGPLDGTIPNENTSNYAYLPFGGGRRKCIGDQFALFESIVAVAMLMRRFEFAQDPASPPVGMTTGATIHTTEGLWMNITPRTDTSPNDPGNSRGELIGHAAAAAMATPAMSRDQL